MRLSDWMKSNDYDDVAVAAITGFDRVTISRSRRGVTRPSKPLLDALFEASNGKITANDFFHAEAVK